MIFCPVPVPFPDIYFSFFPCVFSPPEAVITCTPQFESHFTIPSAISQATIPPHQRSFFLRTCFLPFLTSSLKFLHQMPYLNSLGPKRTLLFYDLTSHLHDKKKRDNTSPPKRPLPRKTNSSKATLPFVSFCFRKKINFRSVW